MAKTAGKRSHGGITKSDPYAAAASKRKVKAGKNLFSMDSSLGQNMLRNPNIARLIVEKAYLKESDVVLEIGPGTGNLSIHALDKAKKLVAIEQDPRMAAEVTKRFQGTPMAKKFELILGDAIKTPFPVADVYISNLPYQISSPFIFKLLAASPAPRHAVIMLQREFAYRLLAKPGDKLYSRLAVNVQMFAKVEHIMKVGKGNFNPPPQVESDVVRITPKKPRPQISFDEWDGMLRICFNRPNRVLRSAFLGTKTVLDMIEANYPIFCAQNDISIDDTAIDAQEVVIEDKDDDEPMDEMDVDDDDLPNFFEKEVPVKSSRKIKSKVYELVRAKVAKVLEQETSLGEKRARQCDEGDFLRLLEAFNKEDLHFT